MFLVGFFRTTSIDSHFPPRMVKMQAVQSAMAVRRQRTRWEETKQAKIRRESRDSLSTPRDSLVSIDGKVYFDQTHESKTMFGQVTMFHVGSVFIVIGLMLVLTALMPGGYVKSSGSTRKNDILGTGSVFVFIGGILTTVSRFISNNEERELNEYIQSRLARSRSGHRLVRDAESGLPTPTRERRFKPYQNGVSCSTLVSESQAAASGASTANGHHSSKTGATSHHKKVGEGNCASSSAIPPLKPHKSPSHEANSSKETNIDLVLPTSESEDAMLSRILEEDEIECEIDDEMRTEADVSTEPLDSVTPDLSMTPTSTFETQTLLETHNTPSQQRRPSKTSSKGSFKSAC